MKKGISLDVSGSFFKGVMYNTILGLSRAYLPYSLGRSSFDLGRRLQQAQGPQTHSRSQGTISSRTFLSLSSLSIRYVEFVVTAQRTSRGPPLFHAAPAPGLSTGSRTSPSPSSLSLRCVERVATSKRTPRSPWPSPPHPQPFDYEEPLVRRSLFKSYPDYPGRKVSRFATKLI